MEASIIPLCLSHLEGFLGVLQYLDGAESLSMEDARRLFYQIAHERRWIFIAVACDKVLGTASLFVEQKFIHHGGKVGHVEDVVVHPKHRGMGMGSRLVQECLKEAKEAGCYKVLLSCKADRVPFYERLGFRPHERQMRVDLR